MGATLSIPVIPAAAGDVRTTCAYCGVGCGIVAGVNAEGGISITGDPRHPANYGRLCAKGAALADTLGSEGRLLHPVVDGQRVSWDAALEKVAETFNEVIVRHGPSAVAFYVSGQLLTEDYYVANKLMKGFIGSANIDTNSRLCMASSVAGHKRAFGEDVVPGVYADFEEADLVVLVGSNLAWCHPVLHQRLIAARETRGTRIVVIDPRETATTSSADLHLKLAPGSDVALFNGLLRHLHQSSAVDVDYVAAHTSDYASAAREVQRFDLASVCTVTGLARDEVTRFYAWFVEHARTVTAYSQGVNQSSAGTDKVNAIINCHLVTGRIGKPGAGPFSLTGQPNAMGGREVGGLANTLAAHVDFDDTVGHRRIAGFWRTRHLARKPGLKAVDMFQAVADGRIKALWIMATNPAVSLPQAARVREALAKCPFVVVSDLTAQHDTAEHAHVLLPAAGWGEKDGTVTNSERRISRQRAFVPVLGEARPDWWIVSEVGKRMGHASAFTYDGPAQIFSEHAALSALVNRGQRRFNLEHVSTLDSAEYAALAPRQWPCATRQSEAGPLRCFSDGRFPTPDGRARFVPTPFRSPASVPNACQPLVLNTGRIRDQWHTMTRSGSAPRLSAHIAEPYVELSPETAALHAIGDAELVVLTAHDQQLVARAQITARQRAGSVFVPMHWSSQHAARATVNALIPAVVDPLSGQPELKHGTVALTRYAAAWYGFAVTTHDHVPATLGYWARMRVAGGWRLELAHSDACLPEALFGALLGSAFDEQVVVYQDARRGACRYAAFADGRLRAALYIAPVPVAVSRSWLVQQLDRALTEDEREAVLAGAPGGDRPIAGEIVCTCHQVDYPTICAAVSAGRQTLNAVAACTSAGTGCGACRDEVQRIIDSSRLRLAV